MLSIVIPVYNEAENILNLLNEISRNIKFKKEILIIYLTFHTQNKNSL